ncbi:MAG: Appr-1-p processing protein, partial [Bacteroidota bacterium]
YQSKENFGLGQVQIVKVENDLWVANMIGQRNIKPGKDGTPPVRYEAIKESLDKVGQFAIEMHASVHMPRIGCGLAGGSWDKMELIVEQALTDKKVAVTVYDFE